MQWDLKAKDIDSAVVAKLGVVGCWILRLAPSRLHGRRFNIFAFSNDITKPRC